MTTLSPRWTGARASGCARRMGPRQRPSCLMLRSALMFGLFASLAAPVHATFHFMQIEMVIAGIDGNPRAQAIQLRTRRPFQHEVEKAKLVVRDAAGENPIELIDMDVDVSNTAEGARILIASADMAKYTDPPVEADFIMANVIPESYLQAGSLMFLNDEETLLAWRLSWGGAAYTGPTGGAFTNDDDSEFGPPYPDPLPIQGKQALQFMGAASDLGSSNAADYMLTPGPAVFTNDAGDMFTVTSIDCPEGPGGDDDSDGVCAGEDNCPAIRNPDQIDFDSDGFGDACDACPGDPAKVEPGDCGCGIADVDNDGNGTADCLDDADDPDDDDNDDPSDMSEAVSGSALCGVGLIPFWPVFLMAMVMLRNTTGGARSLRKPYSANRPGRSTSRLVPPAVRR